MLFKDITTDTQTTYTLTENEQCVFFLFNRSGHITFELTGRNAEAHIFAFFIGKDEEKHTLSIVQNHHAPHTISHTLIKSVVSDECICTYDDTIFIAQNALGSDASQESRALLFSSDATVFMEPTLEILADDVKCAHKATASPIDREALFCVESKGISQKKASDLLIFGFLDDAVGRMQALGTNEETTHAIRTLLRTTL